ncbi:aspartate aminotransferase family protein [Psychrobacillus sp. FSL K6-4046]|uniref:aspartate aminotransferase family protein n=1 Tax=Psychrobacillus sp. FSL K6-4046 TaxID=2921550 RepID=UPI003159991F
MQTSSETTYTVETSKRIFEEACTYIPGGVTAHIKYMTPHPIVMNEAKGSKLKDVDGNTYIDYLLCSGSLLTGHGHPAITEAVTNQLNDMGTTIFGTPHLLEQQMAKRVIELYNGIEMARFTNSGLEATLLAIRIAKGFTGREKLAKFEGHYHGGYDQSLISVNPTMEEAGDSKRPTPVPESRGISNYYLENTVVLPFNDLESTVQLLTENKDEISAVIMEPIQGGYIPATQEFMDGLREITEKYGILLIFDEVKTGFRVGMSGAQGYYNITPDITTLGKVLGGGFPVGLVGGRKEIMEITNPISSRDILSASVVTDKEKNGDKEGVLFHSGTYYGHPTILSAGKATLDLLEKDGTLDKTIERTMWLRHELEALYARYNITMKTIGLGTIFNIVFTDKEILNYRDMQESDFVMREKIDRRLLELGIYIKPLTRYSMSTEHTQEDLEKTVSLHEKVLKELTNL